MKKFLIIILFINASQVFCKPKRGCPKIPAVPVDENFIQGKFHVIRHADTEALRLKNKRLEFIGKTVFKKSLCWDTVGVTDDGEPYRAKLLCLFNDVAAQFCSVNKEDHDKFPDAQGTATLTSTDNSTYISGVSCIAAKGTFWWIATTKGDSVGPEVEKTAFKIFEKAGLDMKVATKDAALTIQEFNFKNDELCE